ncbi:urease accessory protein UreD [Mycobacterium sp. pW049]|uniref:urease accessory protein UreD n=1 Tax=[Mycobacterium] bulgaricum TaxID=3238985 RepID=UPI00351BD7BE
MRSDVVIVARPNRSPRIECRGGIAARLTAADTVHLVSSVATPLGGDAISMRVVVEAGARLTVRTVAATVALPGAATAESHATWTLEIAGELDLDPEPTIVAATSRHFTTTTLTVHEAGAVRLRERVQIGRTGERQGFWSGSLHADVDSKPLLRHRIELGGGSLADDEIAAPRACVSELHYPRSEVDAAGTTLALAAGGCLTTWQGDRL